MNFSRPFILRPIGTTLLAIGLTLAGAIAFKFLPVSSLPNFAIPFINVTAGRPGADPATMAATVAAPLERRLRLLGVRVGALIPCSEWEAMQTVARTSQGECSFQLAAETGQLF